MGQPKITIPPKAEAEKLPTKPAGGKGQVKTNCIEAPIRRLFEKHGRYVAKHPYPFFFIPLILSGCLAIGMLHFEVEMDTEYLVTPKNGPAKAERQVVRKYFDFDLSDRFLPDRAPGLDGFADIVIKARPQAGSDDTNMLTKERMADVIKLDKFVRSVKATDDNGKQYGYEDICAKYKGSCLGLPILLIYNNNASLVEQIPISYPNTLLRNKPFFIGQVLGGVTFKDNTSNVMASAEATRLTYYVQYVNEKEIARSNRWFIALTEALDMLSLPSILFYHCETNSLEEQFNAASADITPKFAAPFTLLITFSVLSCMMNDWVRSKPWLAISGVFSAGISLVSVFGLLSAIGCSAVPQVGLVPFLTLGVGVDNMFILISAWRRATVDGSLKLSKQRQVEERMGQAMHEAAMSITITSLTDILAFGIGAITDFRTVELFCLYTGLSILFCYLYCITFFAAAMVFSGWREHDNRHCFALVKVDPLEESINRSWCYRFWCTGIIGMVPADESKVTVMTSKEKEAFAMQEKFLPVVSVQDPPTVSSSLKEKEAAIGGVHEKFLPPPTVQRQDSTGSKQNDAEEHLVMKFFQKIVGPGLMKPYSKAIVLLIYAAYLAVALWGCAHLRAGVSFSKLSNSGSYLANYYHSKDVLFNKYGPSVSIIFTEPLDYHLQETQEKVLGILEQFENHSDFFYANQSHCWLRAYLEFLKHFPRQINSERDFVQTLRYQFLSMNGPDVFKLDIKFNDEGTRIIGSRFYVQSKWYEKTEEMMLEARRLAKTFTDPKVTVYHQTFIYFDQPVAVLPNTLQNIGIAMAVMFVVAILFVPHPLCAVWVTLATGSIEAGVIGFMTLWDVNVDFISMTYLILCIGFSVDFSVHITYGFISSKAHTSNKKAIDALGTLGYPIFQSGISTILGIIFLCTSISYLFLSFFKCLVLVVVFGVYHAVFVLPVVLSMLGGTCRKCQNGDCGDCGECRERLADKGKHLVTEKGKAFCPTVFKDQMSVV